MRALGFAIASATLALFVLAPAAHAACGDGILDVGEQCDTGATPNTCCTAACTFVPSTDTCRAQIPPCNPPEHCSGASDQCPPDTGPSDQDGDGVCDLLDNCPFAPNPTQDQNACAAKPLKKSTPDELARFASGFEHFLHFATIQEGLGPIFNERSCAFCHDRPIFGGFAPFTVTRFGRYVGGVFDPMTSEGGSLAQAKGITVGMCSVAGERVPVDATVSTLRLATPFSGAGLLEAVPDQTLLALADPSDLNGDGISGRPNMIGGAIGRFGWKAQIATLHEFAGDASLNEMGITSPDFPNESNPQGGAVACDTVADPEDPGSGIAALTDFMTLIAPVPPRKIKGSGRGKSRFHKIGCDRCHLQKLKTGDNTSRALRRQTFRPFTDLLLHDMGPGLADGIEQGDATGSEFRTAPLWAVGRRGPFLHDGRATTLLDAVLAHGGEAQAIRDRFMALDAEDRDAILLFLSSL